MMPVSLSHFVLGVRKVEVITGCAEVITGLGCIFHCDTSEIT